MRALLIASLLTAAACAMPEEPPPPVLPQPQAVAAPTPSDIAIRITAEQAGQTVEVPVGQRFAVELVGVPTAGYVWAAAQTPAFLTAGGETSGATTRAQSQPGFTGGNHWEVLIFSATAAGSGELVLEQRRPWESSEPAANTFRVTITAR